MSTSSPIDPDAASGDAGALTAGAVAPSARDDRVFGHFTAGHRRTGHVNRRYSRAVSLLRVALPLIAVGVFGALILWPDVQEIMAPESPPAPAAEQAMATPVVEQVAEETSGRMDNPRFSGVDGGNRPYNISGSLARPMEQGGVMEIDDPMADIELDDGTWLALQAQQARYDEAAGRIELNGDVNLFRDDGYAVFSDEVVVDIDTQSAWGDAPVVGHGPQGEIVADGFRLDGTDRVIVFTGDARLRIRGGTTAPGL